MFSKNELRYTLALQRVPYLGDATAKKLILKVGSAEGVFKERKKTLLKIKGIGPFKLRALSKKIPLREAEKEMDFMEKNDVISIECDIPPHKLAAVLLSLELKGIIRPLPGKVFKIV